MTNRVDLPPFKRGGTVKINFSLHAGDAVLPIGLSDELTFRLSDLRKTTLFGKLTRADMQIVDDGSTGQVSVVLTDQRQDEWQIPDKGGSFWYELFYLSPTLGGDVQAEGVLKLQKSLKKTLPGT
jgi:hypothetical protein